MLKRREAASYVHAKCRGPEEGMNLGSPRNPKNSFQGRVPGKGHQNLTEDDFWAHKRSQWMDHKVNRQGQETEGGLKEMQSHTSISCEMTQPFTFQKLYLCCSQENKLLEGKGRSKIWLEICMKAV